jgi:hypothetical protein
MKGLGVAALFGFVSFVLSYGLFLPGDLKSFSLIGAVASMVGFILGAQASKVIGLWRTALVIAMAALFLCCVISYVIFVPRGSGETGEVIRLALLLFGIFFSFTFLMPIAGFSIERR